MANRFVRPIKAVALERLEDRRLLAAIVITRGGTYRGTWESQDPDHPAVVVNTSEPVIIEDSTISSRGDLIASGVSHTNITVRRTTGTALNPNIAGESPGRFLTVEQFDNVVLEGNRLNGTRGIHLLNYRGDRTADETVRIVENIATNIDGRRSNGANGWMDFNTKVNLTTGAEEFGFDYAQFVQLDKVLAVPGIEIAWNQVINEPGKSRVEDNISIYKSSGTASSPIRIHDNYIQGAYTIKPTQVSYNADGIRYDWSYSGGGIMLGDGKGTVDEDPAYVKAYDNQVVSTTNYGVAIAAGHHMEARNNRVISSGKLPDGKTIVQQNVGIYVWDSYDAGPGRFHHNYAYHNTAGWVNHSGRNDFWSKHSGTIVANTSWSGTISLATEQAERSRWHTKRAGPRIGTMGGTIFHDLDGDGVRDSADPARRRVRLYLDLDNDATFDSNEPSTLSSSTGRWEFKVPPELYVVRMITPGAWTATRGIAVQFELSAGEVLTRHFGLTPATVVQGMVFMDADRDGKKDALEAPLPLWRVYVDQNGNGVWDASEISTLSNTKGWYAFLNLPPGTYQIRVVQSPNYQLTTPAHGQHTVSITAGMSIIAGHFGQKRIKT